MQQNYYSTLKIIVNSYFSQLQKLSVNKISFMWILAK